MIHRNENRSINFRATIRYLVAMLFPSRNPKLVEGRALTPSERKRA